MQLNEYIATLTLQSVIDMEHRDTQFLVLEQARGCISKHNPHKELFVFLVLQCALVGFQVAGSWPLWWEEFSQKIQNDRALLQTIKHNNIDRWYQFLTTSRYNKRLYNNKRKRLEKFTDVYTDLTRNKSILDYASDMSLLRQHLSTGMKQDTHNKTMPFAIKMYGYAVRIVTNAFVPYPMDVVIPLDSRLRTIYQNQFPGHSDSDKSIIQHYQEIAEACGIPPLHLDAAIWIDYREKHS